MFAIIFSFFSVTGKPILSSFYSSSSLSKIYDQSFVSNSQHLMLVVLGAASVTRALLIDECSTEKTIPHGASYALLHLHNFYRQHGHNEA